jgi:hypothetical protein
MVPATIISGASTTFFAPAALTSAITSSKAVSLQLSDEARDTHVGKTFCIFA